MRNKLKSSTYFRLCLSLVLLVPFFSFTQAQKDILLYSSEITDWPALDFSAVGSSSTINTLHTTKDYNFYADYRPIVYPTTTLGGNTGYIAFSGNGGTLSMGNVNLIQGGVVVVGVCQTSTSSARTLALTVNGLSTDITSSFTVIPASMSVAPTVIGNSANFGRQLTVNGLFEVTYIIPPSYTGNVTLSLKESSLDLKITSLQVYTSVATLPYVAATNFPATSANGVEFFALKDGPLVSENVNIKGWNVTEQANLSIVGDDAAKFELSESVISNVDLLSGKNIVVSYTPSVQLITNKAQLLIASPGLPNYYVALTGNTTLGNSPELNANFRDSLYFWTSLIKSTSQKVKIKGYHLTGPVSLTLTGANASSFLLSNRTIPIIEATNEREITIDYVGSTFAGKQYANLVLSSPGASSIQIPLVGVSSTTKADMYNMIFQASPGGSAVIKTVPSGTSFPKGSKVVVSVTPEQGYAFKYWSDGQPATSISRTFMVTDTKNGLFTAYLSPACCVDPLLSTSKIDAYFPRPETITTDGFTAEWTPVVGATSYIITVFDAQTRALVQTQGATSNSVVLTGLLPNTAYMFEVTSNTGLKSPQVGPFYTLPTSVSNPCLD